MSAAALALSGLAPNQADAEPAFTFTAGSPVGVAGRTAGYRFTTDEGYAVTRLGYWDRDGDGIEGEPRPVGLWDSSGTLLATATFELGTDADLVDNFRFLDVPPVVIGPGETYTLGALIETTNAGGLVSSITDLAPASGITLTQNVATELGATMLTQPTILAGVFPGIFGANANVEPLDILVYEPVIAFTGEATTTATDQTLGFTLAVDERQWVTQLGVWDEGDDGLGAAHDVGVWDGSGTLISSASVPAAAVATLVDGFRYVDVDAFALDPGQTYTIGAHYPAAVDDIATSVSGFAAAANTVFGMNVATTAAGPLAQPTINGVGDGTAYFGPNLRVALPVLHCGDGTLQADVEACDGDLCCAETCVPLAAATVCRTGSGDSCDPDETCDGSSGSCPDDVLASNVTVCRVGSGDTCDPDETCSGTAGEACPDDAVLSGGTVCRAGSGDVCDPEEQCSGTAGEACPDDTVAVDGTDCEDGTFCSVMDTCQTGVCVDGDTPCEANETCNEKSDMCLPNCGNGSTDAGEECDDGDANSDEDPDACRTDCSSARCGDNVVDSGEACDLGPDGDLEMCTAECELPSEGSTSEGSTGDGSTDGGSTSGGATGSDTTDAVTSSSTATTAGMTTTGASTSVGDADSSGDDTGDTDDTGASADSGCGCRSSNDGGPGLPMLLGGLLALGWARRRRIVPLV